MTIVTLTTDFGLRDPYVAEMKGVLIAACPEARLVDVTHEIAPGDVWEANWVLGRIWSVFPAGTVNLVVVDPGVGSRRLPLAVWAGGRWFVGPDNGVLDSVLNRWPADAVHRIEPSRLGVARMSDTFHGRDLFSPTAGRLARGESGDSVGGTIDPGRIVRLERAIAARDGDQIRGRVIHTDRFGNLITDIPSEWLSDSAVVTIGGRAVLGIERSYTAVPSGALVATRGSGGTLEISARGVSAASLLGVGRGEIVTVEESAAQ